MSINFKNIYECPPWNSVKTCIRDFLDGLAKLVEASPEEFQRDVQLSKTYASEIIGSILLGYPLDCITLSRQEKKYKTKSSFFDKLKKGFMALYKNLNGLQRVTAMIWFESGIIKTPPNLNNCIWNNKNIRIGGKSIHVLREKHPEFMEERWNKFPFYYTMIGDETQVCNRRQESYIFTKVLNNAIPLTAQMLRQATTALIAKWIRNVVRHEPLSLWKPYTKKLFASPSHNKEMKWEELAALIVQFFLTGFSTDLGKKRLDELYQNSDLQDGLKTKSTEFGKDVNVKDYLEHYSKFIYKILDFNDRENAADVNMAEWYSIIAYTHLHMITGVQNKFDYEKLAKQFWDIHDELLKAIPMGASESEYRTCLRSNTVARLKDRKRIWRETLQKRSKKLLYVIYRDSTRTYTKKQITRKLREQGWVCAVDGLPLTIDEAVGGHDLAWSKGGFTVMENLIVIREEHNKLMGTDTLKEHKKSA